MMIHTDGLIDGFHAKVVVVDLTCAPAIDWWLVMHRKFEQNTTEDHLEHNFMRHNAEHTKIMRASLQY